MDDQKVLISLIVRNKDTILVGKYDGFDMLPTGLLNTDTDTNEIIDKGIFQDIGIKLKNVRKFTFARYDSKNHGKGTVMLLYVAAYDSGEIKDNNKWSWINPSEINIETEEIKKVISQYTQTMSLLKNVKVD